jgi:hypothetical protein
MGRHCKYCGQSGIKLDDYGFCVKYDCQEHSGFKAKLRNWVVKAGQIYTYTDSLGQVSGPVSNFYSKRHRYADDIKSDDKLDLGLDYTPHEVIEALPEKYRYAKWDANIRW